MFKKVKSPVSETEQAVIDYMPTIGKSFKLTHICLTEDERGWKYDQWRVELAGQTFEYKTGIGHRTINKCLSQTDIQWLNRLKSPTLDIITRYTRQNTPDLAGVIYSLIMDSQAAQESFSDFCDNYGYSNDSISALHTYQECDKIKNKLVKVFTREQVSYLQELLQDY
jgi:hypothetical protein